MITSEATHPFYHPPKHHGIVCDSFGCFKYRGCKEFCYRIRIYPIYHVDTVCCSLKGKFIHLKLFALLIVYYFIILNRKICN